MYGAVLVFIVAVGAMSALILLANGAQACRVGSLAARWRGYLQH